MYGKYKTRTIIIFLFDIKKNEIWHILCYSLILTPLFQLFHLVTPKMTNKPETKAKRKAKTETENIFDCRAFILNNNISLAHNPELTKEFEVFHLYGDGKISRQEGGKKYGKGKETVLEKELPNNDVCIIFGEQIKHTDALAFPTPTINAKIKFVILTKENALKIRRKMIKFIECSITNMRQTKDA
jgi:hypothetical protein